MSCLQYHLILDYRERLNYCKGLMAKICFLLLCHKNPEQIVEQAEMLTDSGDFVSIHFDRRGRPAGFLTINEALEDNQNICFAQRVKCGWGKWSLVQRSEEHTSELQSRRNLVCRLLLEKKKRKNKKN